MPFVAGAAYNDVTLTTDVVLSVGGYSLNVSGSSATIESITVDTSSFTFTLLPSSYLRLTSSDRLSFIGVSGSSAEFSTDRTCTDSESITIFQPVSGAANSITVTPNANTCTTPTANTTNSSGSSSGNNGGGGGTTLPTTPATPTPAPQALIAAAPQAVFNRLLSTGSTGDDVRALQTRLIAEGLLKAQATGYFGPLTRVAVKAYQAKYGIDQLGIVGPMTRAQLNKGSSSTENPTTAPASVSALMLQINALLKQVQELQAKLKAQTN